MTHIRFIWTPGKQAAPTIATRVHTRRSSTSRLRALSCGLVRTLDHPAPPQEPRPLPGKGYRRPLRESRVVEVKLHGLVLFGQWPSHQLVRRFQLHKDREKSVDRLLDLVVISRRQQAG